jgi:thiamine-monophosphate kinase
LALTTDFLVEGIDFDLAYATPDSIGWKAVAVNASDIAAMGGTPAHAVTSLSLRPDVEVAFVDGVLDGLVAAGGEFGVSLVGGDLSRATEIMISVAMTGSLEAAPVVRGTAGVDELICVTGTLGAAAAGLRVLREGRAGLDDVGTHVTKHQLYPRPPVEAGPALARCGATAMIDVSDGFALDLGRLLRAGGVGCAIDLAAVPVDDDARTLFGDEALDQAMAGGEDYELLFTIPRARMDDAVRQLGGVRCTVVGRTTDGDRLVGDEPLAHWEERGWDHLLGR